MCEENNRTENDALIEAIKDLCSIESGSYSVEESEDSTRLMFVPKGMARYVIPEQEIDELRGAPRRRKGSVRALTLDSFISLTKRYAAEETVIYVDDKRFVAVLNDHAPKTGKPGFRDHWVVYDPSFSDAWEAWMENSNKQMSQAEFSSFLEDHVLDLVDVGAAGEGTQKIINALGVTVASPATLRALARDLSVRVKQQVREARNLSSGETQILFSSEHQGEDGKPLVVPGAFLVAIPVFEGGAHFVLVARLRYRVGEGRILWSYAISASDKAESTVFEEAMKRVLDETGVLVVRGAP